MRQKQVFIGNIKKCTKYINHSRFNEIVYIGDKCINLNSFGYVETEDEVYKENVLLVKIKNGGYIDLENFNSILDYIKIYKDNLKEGYALWKTIIPAYPREINSLFVDEKSLKPYFNKNKEQTDISLYKLSKKYKKEN